MSKEQESLKTEIYGLLKSRGLNPISKESSGDTVPIPEEADVFEFMFSKDGKDYGKVWVTLDGLRQLIVYFGKDVADSPKNGSEDSNSWSQLHRALSRFATSRQLSFELSDQSNLEADMAKREHTKREEQVNEGYYPISKTASGNNNIPSVTMRIQHTRTIEEGEQRYRNIARIFVENQDGERILLPTTKPGLARTYVRHIAEGGKPNDERWNHLNNLCEEYQKMAGFVRATRNGQFNESAQSLVNEGINHYQKLRETLGKLQGKRGYNAYFESYTPALMEDEEQVDLSEMFMSSSLDPRIESVMPILSKLSKNITETTDMAETIALENWADEIITHKGGKVSHKDGVTRHQSGPDQYGGFDPDSHPDSPDIVHTRRGATTGHKPWDRDTGEYIKKNAVKKVDEISNKMLGDYKTAAGADASAADKAGDFKRGNKRFKGINKATIKQFDNDLKKHKQQGVAEGQGVDQRKLDIIKRMHGILSKGKDQGMGEGIALKPNMPPGLASATNPQANDTSSGWQGSDWDPEQDDGVEHLTFQTRQQTTEKPGMNPTTTYSTQNTSNKNGITSTHDVDVDEGLARLKELAGAQTHPVSKQTDIQGSELDDVGVRTHPVSDPGDIQGTDLGPHSQPVRVDVRGYGPEPDEFGRQHNGSHESDIEMEEGSVEQTPTGLKHHGDFPDYPREKGKEFNHNIDRLNKSETGKLDKAFGVHWNKGPNREVTGDPTGVAEGSQEDAKFTPRFEVRSRIEGALDQYLDPEQVAGGYTDIQYYKHDGRVYVEVLFNYTNGQKIGPTQRKRFLVNKDFTLTPIKRQQGVAEGELKTSHMNKQHQDFYDKNPHHKDMSKEVTNVGGRLATKVTPTNKPAQVTKKPITKFESTDPVLARMKKLSGM